MSEFKYHRPEPFPPVVKNLIIINVLVFVAQQIFQHSETVHLQSLFALHDVHSVYFKPHQIVTHLFMHGGWDHLFFNMLALWMFGRDLENSWGPKRFLIFYMSCGLGAALLHLGVLYFESEAILRALSTMPQDEQLEKLSQINYGDTVGASGAIFGCLAAYGYLFPNTMVYVYFLLPLKAKWFVIIYAALELWFGIRNSAGDNVAHFAHLGGAITGIILVFLWNKTNRRRFY